MSEIRLTIPGPPRTKKNSLRRKKIGKQVKTIPSATWCAWRDLVMAHRHGILDAFDRQGDSLNYCAPVTDPMNICALFYRDAERGDAVGYYQGLADVLEEIGVVQDDKFLTSWDGSRLLKDAANPRVEVVLSWNDGGAA